MAPGHLADTMTQNVAGSSGMVLAVLTAASVSEGRRGRAEPALGAPAVLSLEHRTGGRGSGHPLTNHRTRLPIATGPAPGFLVMQARWPTGARPQAPAGQHCPAFAVSCLMGIPRKPRTLILSKPPGDSEQSH